MNKTRKNQRFLVSQSSERNFRKVGIFMVFVLLVGAVFLSACDLADQEAVGRKISGINDPQVDDIPNQKVDFGEEEGEPIRQLREVTSQSCDTGCYDAGYATRKWIDEDGDGLGICTCGYGTTS